MLEVLRRSSETVFVPLTVGRGIRDFTDSNGKAYTALEVASAYFSAAPTKSPSAGTRVRRGGVLRERRREGRKHVRGTDSSRYGAQAVISVDPRRVYVADPA